MSIQSYLLENTTPREHAKIVSKKGTDITFILLLDFISCIRTLRKIYLNGITKAALSILSVFTVKQFLFSSLKRYREK